MVVSGPAFASDRACSACGAPHSIRALHLNMLFCQQLAAARCLQTWLSKQTLPNWTLLDVHVQAVLVCNTCRCRSGSQLCIHSSRSHACGLSALVRTHASVGGILAWAHGPLQCSCQHLLCCATICSAREQARNFVVISGEFCLMLCLFGKLVRLQTRSLSGANSPL